MKLRSQSSVLILLLLAIVVTFVVSGTAVAEPGGKTDETEGPLPVQREKPRLDPMLSAQALRGPVDEEVYIVGPGDTFAVTIGGQATGIEELPVTPEGDVVLPGVTSVRVAGQTLARAKEDVRAALEKHYRKVKISVTLVRLRLVEVHVVGNVLYPGTYVATALDVASDLIQQAGGLGIGASERNILVTRRNGGTETADLVQYERVGDLAANPPILDGDLIYVPYAKATVSISGAVEEPGEYEFVPGDTIGSLVEIAGGLTPGALPDTLELRRFVDNRRTESTFIPNTKGAGWGWALTDGSQVFVRYEPKYRLFETVELVGELHFPGDYAINEGTDRVSDVLFRAGGFTEDASLTEAQLIRTSDVEKEDPEFERLKDISVEDMTKTEYAYFKSKAREQKGAVVVDFVRLLAGDEDQNLLLRSGDRIVVPEQRETITVSGSVAHPGLITYVQDEKASYYIEKAGGFASTADRRGARVIRGITGEWESFGEAGAIIPGDEVWVPEEPERDWWVFARETVGFVASLATIYLVIDQATGN